MSDSKRIRNDLGRVVRRERGRLVADLVRRLGNQHFALAEDVAQDALVKAMSVWPYDGVPDNPGAWLAKVARNKAIDQLRRLKKETEPPSENASSSKADSVLFEAQVDDPELRLVLLCCHPDLSELEQLTLTLKLASGFATREIADVFLAKEDAVGQRIARAKRTLRALGNDLDQLPLRFGIESRMPSTLKVVYLMFSIGYAPLSGDRSMRRDVALEALRLAEELAANDIMGTADSHALAALLCFQASRLEARESADGDIILLAQQDRSLWNRDLIDRGFGHLVASKATGKISRYHLEAGIAATHAAAIDTGSCDWKSIAAQYEQLETMVKSPTVANNAAVAIAMAGDPTAAMKKLDALGSDKHMQEYAPYHIARAEVLRLLRRNDDAAASYQDAMRCRVSTPVIRHLEERLVTCL